MIVKGLIVEIGHGLNVNHYRNSNFFRLGFLVKRNPKMIGIKKTF
jgi:hypothetical protein